MNYRKVLEENTDNTDLFRGIVSEVNSWDGSLESFEVHDFDDDFFDTYFEGKPMDAARATFFGSIDSWSDDYIRFDGYGNLESLRSSAYADELSDGKDEIIDRAIELREGGHIDLDYLFERHDIKEEEEEENAG